MPPKAAPLAKPVAKPAAKPVAKQSGALLAPAAVAPKRAVSVGPTPLPRKPSTAATSAASIAERVAAAVQHNADAVISRVTYDPLGVVASFLRPRDVWNLAVSASCFTRKLFSGEAWQPTRAAWLKRVAVACPTGLRCVACWEDMDPTVVLPKPLASVLGLLESEDEPTAFVKPAAAVLAAAGVAHAFLCDACAASRNAYGPEGPYTPVALDAAFRQLWGALFRGGLLACAPQMNPRSTGLQLDQIDVVPHTLEAVMLTALTVTSFAIPGGGKATPVMPGASKKPNKAQPTLIDGVYTRGLIPQSFSVASDTKAEWEPSLLRVASGIVHAALRVVKGPGGVSGHGSVADAKHCVSSWPGWGLLWTALAAQLGYSVWDLKWMGYDTFGD